MLQAHEWHTVSAEDYETYSETEQAINTSFFRNSHITSVIQLGKCMFADLGASTYHTLNNHQVLKQRRASSAAEFRGNISSMHFNTLLSFYKNPWSLFVSFYFSSLSLGLNWPQTIAWSYIHWSPGECSLNDQESGHGLGQLITPSGKYLLEGQVSCVCLWPDAPVK